MRNFALLLLVAVVALQSPVLQGQGTQAPGVTFQVEVNYVDVDVVVTDAQGNFVTGLTRDDFEVFENGKPQKIDTFSMVEIPVEKPTEFVYEGRPVVADTQTNRKPFDGRVYVIVLDDLDVSAMRSTPLKDAARKFVREFMGANDLAAVVYTSGRKDAAQEFTTNRELLVAAIDKFIGQRMRSLSLERLDSYYQTIAFGYTSQNDADPNTGSINSQDPAGYGRVSDPTELERGTRALNVLDTLKNTAEFLGSVRGRRKALLFFSEGLDYPIRDVFGAHDATTVIRASQDAISMAARANVNFYAVDPRGLAGMTTRFHGRGRARQRSRYVRVPSCSCRARTRPASGITGASGGTFDVQDELMQEFRTSQDTLRELTEETGGFASLNTNNVAPAFERIVNANSRYYVLGYYPPTHPRDGRFHKIEVRVKRPNLRVEARKGYASPRGRTPEERKRDEEARLARDARRPDGKRTSTPLLTALASPIPQSGLTFTMQAAPFKNTANEASIALAIELDGSKLPYSEPNAKGTVSNKIELSFFGLNAQGKAICAGLDRARSHAPARNARSSDRARRAREPAHQPASGAVSNKGWGARIGEWPGGFGVLRPRGARFPQGAAHGRRAADDDPIGAADAEHSAGSEREQRAVARAGDQPPRISAQRCARALHGNLRQRQLTPGASCRRDRAAGLRERHRRHCQP